ncbi:MAG: twitch domain-containing radical SAM protein [Bacteriovoracaceae bacterium]|jgi:MoaA/NifB/PqqE/SkfB family radical SAM enzyme|nr:twitch domain-containing radical SAM protein [Bacteriovoracaceae bacterium]
MGKVFCPTPWNSLSILPDGRLRLCCHANHHHILPNVKTENLKESIDIWQNKLLIEARENFAQNRPLSACDVCLKNEKETGHSARKELQSNYPVIDKKNFKLELLDISFSNACNMQCPMCSTNFSSKWAHDFGQKSIKKSNILNNKYIKENIKELKEVIIQGGEPLLSDDHLPFLKLLSDKSYPENIVLNYITNFSLRIPQQVINEWKKFKHIKLNISIEGIEETYEMTRPPQKWQRIQKLFEQIFELKAIPSLDISFSFKTLIYIYNLHDIPRLLRYLERFEKVCDIVPDFDILTYPTHLRVEQISKTKRAKLCGAIEKYIVQKNDKRYSSLDQILKQIQQAEVIPVQTEFWKSKIYFEKKYGLKLDKNLIADLKKRL